MTPYGRLRAACERAGGRLRQDGMRNNHDRRTMIALLAGLALSTAAVAKTEAVSVSGAWVRPAAAGMNSAVYMTLTNHGGADRLLSATSPFANSAQVHISRMAAGVMTMRPVNGLDVGAGETVIFSPHGLHLMLESLRKPLRLGDRIAVDLVFAHAGHVRAMVAVSAGPQAQKQAADPMAGMKM